MNILNKVKSNKGLVKYLTNTIWLVSEKVGRLFLALFVSIWVAKYLGPEKFGVLNYAQSYAAMFLPIAGFGLDSIVIRELTKSESKIGEILGTAFSIKLFGAFLTILMIVISLNTLDISNSCFIMIISFSAIFQSINVIDFYFQSKVISRYIVIANSITLVIISIFKIYFIMTDKELSYFVYIILIESFITALGYTYMYLKHNNEVKKWKYNKSLAKNLIKDSWPLIFSTLMVSVYMKLDQVMLKFYINDTAVGEYAAAVRLSEAWYFIPMVISASVFPAIINAKKISHELYYSRIQKLFNFMFLISITVAFFITFSSKDIISLLYGNEYNNTAEILIIHVWSGLFVGLGVCRGRWIVCENLQIYTIYFLGGGLIINIILNMLLIPKLGGVGAAYATLISQACGTFIIPVFFKKTRITFFMMLKSMLIFPAVLEYFRK